MTELRRDFLSGEWVAISPVRAERPTDFGGGVCPFCPQNEHMTPPETYRSEHVRVFPNKYPALARDCPEGYGIHEILVDTELHDQQLHELSSEHIAEVFAAIQNRLAALRADKKIKYVQVFKNHGYSAGASLNHSHWQILAMPVLSSKQRRISRGFREYFKEHGRCWLCDCQADKSLVVAETDAAVAYVPFASVYSYGVNIMPRRHVSDFAALNAVERLALAEMLRLLISAMLELHPGVGYNICLQNVGGSASHTYMQLIPRLGSFAGFELATGCFINSIDPETTARQFKDLIKV